MRLATSWVWNRLKLIMKNSSSLASFREFILVASFFLCVKSINFIILLFEYCSSISVVMNFWRIIGLKSCNQYKILLSYLVLHTC